MEALKYNDDLTTFYLDRGKLTTKYFRPGTGWITQNLAGNTLAKAGAQIAVVRDYGNTVGRLDVFVENQTVVDSPVDGIIHAWYVPGNQWAVEVLYF